ncbi:MAG: sugar transferase [Peptoniphilaceae bacterium]|nr:sugar transferase [Peptoniphilaceae bacterium]MDD7383363.1 sugar transferase [Peptoniphilaceae bacterium]MDY3738266.1 sugar transferase [Peptoniphilaceae bacterium]
MYRKFFKNIIDRIIALFIFIILIPFSVCFCIFLKLKNTKEPIFFVQQRSGKNRKPFKCYKFRTMKIDTPKNVPTNKLENPEKYITKTGKFLRKTSIDELPQILNIILGDMSFIGPRPVILNETELLDLRDEYGANDVKPGLTGLAQISGRDNLKMKEKAQLDGEYARNLSFLYDLKIILRTIPYVLKKEGIKEGI